jgi:integrase
MLVLLKKYADGRLRKHWYGKFERNGRTHVVTLCRWSGQPPASLKSNDSGDEKFEASRRQAVRELQELVTQRRSRADEEYLAQKIHQLHYGAKVETTALEDIPRRWAQLPRKRRCSAKHTAKCELIFNRFQLFMQQHAPDVKEMGAVTGEQMRAFMEAEERRGVTPGTWNETLILLKGLFRRFEPYSDAWRSYLSTQPAKDTEVVHREPFSPEEIKAVLRAAEDAPEIKPLIVTALCTAMRRGDVCRLRWRDVNLKDNMILVKTNKTGALVEIPIFPPLREVLDQVRLGRDPKPEDFVFPAAAELYATNPHGLDWRLKGVLQRAGYLDPQKVERVQAQQTRRAGLDVLPPRELQRRGLQAMEAEKMSEARRARMREIFTRYMRGESVKKIASEMPVSVGTVSGHLAAVERLTGAVVIRQRAAPEIIRGHTLAAIPEGAQRKNRASLKGWHSFRTTWITLALAKGVPEMIVRRVTGHASVDIVMKHYFRPGRAEFRATLAGALPKALTAGKSPDRLAEAINIIRRLPVACVREKKRLLELLAPVAVKQGVRPGEN